MFLPANYFSTVYRCLLSLYENNRESPFSCQDVGKSETLQELWESIGTNRQKPNILAKLYYTQMQAEIHQNCTGNQSWRSK